MFASRGGLSRLFARARTSTRILAIAMVVCLAAFAAASRPTLVRAQGPSDTVADPGPSADGVPVNPHQLPPISTDGGPEQVRQVPRQYPVDAATFGQMKAAANAAAHWHGGGSTPPPAPPPNSATLGISDGGGWNPPDGGLAVGPSSILVAVNEAFAIYNKAAIDNTVTPATPAVGPVRFQSFFGTGSDSTFDPRALYDAGNTLRGGSGRFVLLATTMNSTRRTSSYVLAISQNSNPSSASTGWCRYTVNAVTGSYFSTAWADFPGLGMDGNNLFITSNQFTFGSGRYQYARLLVIPKASVYPDATSGACPTLKSWSFTNLKNLDGSTAFTVQPASQPDAVPGSTTAMYFVNAIWASGSRLTVRSMTGSASTMTTAPSLGSPRWVGVSAYNLPADAPQPGGSAIDTGDTRLAGAVYRNGTIYTANTTQSVSSSLTSTPNPAANVQWYSFAPAATTAASAAIADPSVAYSFPAVLPACTGTGCSFVGLEVSGSGAGQPASAFYVKGSGSPTAFATGVGGYTLNGRWGDYAAAATDPSDSGAVWVLGEYASATNAWRTAVGIIR